MAGNLKYGDLFAFLDEKDVEHEVQVRQQSVGNIRLRPYQIDAVDAVFRQWKSGDRATLICLPTGTGKSVCFSETMRRWVEQNA